MGDIDERKIKAFNQALKAIKEDPAGFKNDPKGKVGDLDDDAVKLFKGMKDLEYDALLEIDERMQRAGFTIKHGNLSVRMV